MTAFDVWELSLAGSSPYTWTLLTNATAGAPSARSLHTVVSYNSSTFFVFGGKLSAGKIHLLNVFFKCLDFSASNELWVFDRITNTWTLTGTSGGPPPARYGHVAAYVGGKMIINGGQDTSGAYLDDSWIFDFGN